MHFDWGIFKRHPYITAIGGVGLFVVIYVLVKSGGGGGGGAAASGGTATDPQLAALQAQEDLAGLQAQTQLQVAQTQAGVQGQAISASQDVTNNQTQASLTAYTTNSNNALAATKDTNATQVALAQVQAGTQASEMQALADIVDAQYTAQSNSQANVLAYLTNLTNVQGEVAQTQIETNAQLSSQTIDALTANKGLSRNNTQLAQVLSTIQAALPWAQGSASTLAASSSKQPTNNAASQIGGGAAAALAALFGA